MFADFVCWIGFNEPTQIQVYARTPQDELAAVAVVAAAAVVVAAGAAAINSSCIQQSGL